MLRWVASSESESPDLTAGKSSRGWVTFQLPTTVTTGFVTFADSQWSFTVK